MTTLFISDLHLEESRSDITALFLHFLINEAPKAEALYILGDLFEVWIGDDAAVTPFHQAIINALKNLDDNGVKIYFMHGNRDFLIDEAFAQQTGITLLTDPTIITLNGESVLLMHGDTLCTADIDYLQFRQQVRNPLFQQGFLSKTIAERIAYAKQIRDISKTEGKNKSSEIMDVTPTAVIDIMQQFNVSTLIHGHTHRPAIHNLIINKYPAQRIVLGDWGNTAQILRVDNNHPTELTEIRLP